jgi:hypothetical protein
MVNSGLRLVLAGGIEVRGDSFRAGYERIFATKAPLTSAIAEAGGREKSFWPSRFMGY